MNPVGRSEAELVAHAQRGDRNAADELLRVLYPQIFALCRRLTGNHEDALDATQEALSAIVRGLGSFQGASQVRTWAYRVATNTCHDELRRRSRRPMTDPIETDHPVAPVDVALRMDIDTALKQLPIDFRTAVVLRDLMQMDYADIAVTLDVPVGTVRSRIARGRKILANLLADGNQSEPLDVEGVE